jgi:hypothetical protein
MTPTSGSPPASWLALAVTTDSSTFLVLDADRGAYLAVDPIGPDDFDEIGADVEVLLDWIATHLR